MEFPTLHVENIKNFIDKVVAFIIEATDNMKKFIEGFTSDSII